MRGIAQTELVCLNKDFYETLFNNHYIVQDELTSRDNIVEIMKRFGPEVQLMIAITKSAYSNRA